VLGIGRVFREGIDAAHNVPAGAPESFHTISVDIVVGVEREATRHTSVSRGSAFAQNSALSLTRFSSGFVFTM
jgi:hypothetical protein